MGTNLFTIGVWNPFGRSIIFVAFCLFISVTITGCSDRVINSNQEQKTPESIKGKVNTNKAGNDATTTTVTLDGVSSNNFTVEVTIVDTGNEIKVVDGSYSSSGIINTPGGPYYVVFHNKATPAKGPSVCQSKLSKEEHPLKLSANQKLGASWDYIFFHYPPTDIEGEYVSIDEIGAVSLQSGLSSEIVSNSDLVDQNTSTNVEVLACGRVK